MGRRLLCLVAVAGGAAAGACGGEDAPPNEPIDELARNEVAYADGGVVVLDRFTGVELGEPSAQRKLVEMPFSDRAEAFASPIRDLTVCFGRGLYDCD